MKRPYQKVLLSSIISAGTTLALIPSVSHAETSFKVLTLPFNNPDVYLGQGWVYTYSSQNHQGIDYVKGVYPNWVGFDVVAAFGGELTCYPDGTYSGYGNMCTVKHVVNGQIFYTLYAHLEYYDKENGFVTTGEKLGYAGQTGTGIIHLHFEVQVNSLCLSGLCRRDPYALYETREVYPGYENYQGSGLEHWWSNDPPVLPDEQMSESCNDGLQNQGEFGIDCGGPCPPCDPPECSDGDRRRCWVECTQDYPPECIYDLGPLLMGIETCNGGQWGFCETADGLSCAQLTEPCANQTLLSADYECVDGTLKNGAYTCITPLGAECSTSYYRGWPPHDCPEDLCLTGEDACQVDNAEQPCEIYCNMPGGSVIQGTQTCQSYCGNNLAWSSCIPNNPGECLNL